MIELGERKGIPNEKHFVLKVDGSLQGLPVATYEFDIYAETPDEAKATLMDFFSECFSKHRFKVKERNDISS